MKSLKLLALAGALTLSTSGGALAATQNATGCPTGAWTDYSSPGGVSISWALSGVSPILSFQPTRIVMGGGIAPLTPAQAEAYAPALDNLRAAAAANRQVTVYWEDSTRTVSALIVRWNQPC